jgi:hypothetical protein
MLDPVGVDRWPFELGHKYGMRDGYVCSIGGQWGMGFWSRKLLPSNFTQEARGLLFMAASAAAARLEQLVGEDMKRVDSRTKLTARELSVLRHASRGEKEQEIAKGVRVAMDTFFRLDSHGRG